MQLGFKPLADGQRAADRARLRKPHKDGESAFLGELLEDGQTDECAGTLEPHCVPQGG